MTETTTEFIPNAFVIRTSGKDGHSRNGFFYPREVGAIVECPDWMPTKECKNGLHGLIDGIGGWHLLSSAHDALWWVIGVRREECVDLGDKVKFPRGKVVYFGGINGALNAISKEWRRVALEAAKEVSATAISTSGDWAHASTSGTRAHASTSGMEAHASTSGTRAHASTSGDWAHASTSGMEAHASTSGDWAHASTSGMEAHASTSGDWAHASTSGDWAHASTSGTRAHASTSGTRAHASTSGEKSVSSGLGYDNQARAVEGGAICLVNRDDYGNIIAIRASKVGDNGIKPNTWYKLDAAGEFVEIPDEVTTSE